MPNNQFSFENRDNSFLQELGNPAVFPIYAPLTGATIVAPTGQSRIMVNPAGTIAALTIRLPLNPIAGDMIDIGFTQIVTALTLQNAAGVAIAGAPTSGAPGVSIGYTYVSATQGWVRWR